MMPTADRSRAVSSFTLIKGVQLEATVRAFQSWDLSASKKENLDRIRRDDPLGARSAAWLRDLLFTLSRRFDTDGRDRILIELIQANCPLTTWKPILLWHMTREEFLVRDFLSGWLYENYAQGTWRIRVDDVLPYLQQLARRSEVQVKERWSASTSHRVASGLLKLAVDFDLMTGTLSREFQSYHLPEPALLYLVHAAAEAVPNAQRLVMLPDWHMYLLSAEDLQQELFRLHQFRSLHYEVAGSIGQLRLPYPTAADYARAELIP